MGNWTMWIMHKFHSSYNHKRTNIGWLYNGVHRIYNTRSTTFRIKRKWGKTYGNMGNMHRWILIYGWCRNRAGIKPPNDSGPLRYALPLTFKVTNNKVEYEALITGLRPTRGVRVTSLSTNCDSQLVVNQVNGEYKSKWENGKKNTWLKPINWSTKLRIHNPSHSKGKKPRGWRS